MNKFRRLGLIEYNGQIRIHPSLLESVLNERPEIEIRAGGESHLLSQPAFLSPDVRGVELPTATVTLSLTQ